MACRLVPRLQVQTSTTSRRPPIRHPSEASAQRLHGEREGHIARCVAAVSPGCLRDRA
ncbi:hypothetical protein NITLEN_30138 [Nitrospira lenta]|uniref:Uncharacterized protein n=1 Tax=Nitrospira lenta TaxID=1436998 RepID=A0A330L640_9BACT|nr:hypothetical protein NITLEN_30138 [Nitrospira lenta]